MLRILGVRLPPVPLVRGFARQVFDASAKIPRSTWRLSAERSWVDGPGFGFGDFVDPVVFTDQPVFDRVRRTPGAVDEHFVAVVGAE